MSQHEERNAIIESVCIKIQRNFFLDASMTLSYGNGGAQVFGDYVLKQFARDDGIDFTGTFILGCMNACGVSDWSECVGKSIRVRIADHRISAVGHIIKDDKWFYPTKAFSDEREKATRTLTSGE